MQRNGMVSKARPPGTWIHVICKVLPKCFHQAYHEPIIALEGPEEDILILLCATVTTERCRLTDMHVYPLPRPGIGIRHQQTCGNGQ